MSDAENQPRNILKHIASRAWFGFGDEKESITIYDNGDVEATSHVNGMLQTLSISGDQAFVSFGSGTERRYPLMRSPEAIHLLRDDLRTLAADDHISGTEAKKIQQIFSQSEEIHNEWNAGLGRPAVLVGLAENWVHLRSVPALGDFSHPEKNLYILGDKIIMEENAAGLVGGGKEKVITGVTPQEIRDLAASIRGRLTHPYLSDTDQTAIQQIITQYDKKPAREI